MTVIYDWFSFPRQFSVKCPRCDKECRGSEVPNIKNGTRYKPEGIPEKFECRISCTNCGYQNETAISWPSEAYWTFEIKGKILWAWSVEHAKVILEYIRSGNRQEFQFQSGYAASLYHLPEYFKLAKNREATIKAIENGINKNT